MAEYAQFLETMKQAAVEAMEASKPFALTYGVVKKSAPLTICVEQKLELGPAQLLLTGAVRERKVDMTVAHWTEDETRHSHIIHDTYTNGGTAEPTEHKHAYTGRKQFTVHTGLQAGEKVLLLRIQGGQRYIVLDRVEVAQ